MKHQTTMWLLAAGMSVLVNAGCASRRPMSDEQMIARLSHKTTNLLAQAQAAINDGQVADAERLLSQAEHAGQKSASARAVALLRGELEVREGRAEKAVARAREILGQDSRSRLGHELLGKALLQAGDLDGSEQSFREVVISRAMSSRGHGRQITCQSSPG